ncbi:MAG: type 4a pilus biogenesis protein PilO, partial [Candidatus Aminicenantes bacterium]
IYLFFFKPREATIANTREERIRVENEVTKLKAQQRQLDQIKNELLTMTATFKELEVVIPQQREIYEILKQIQQLAYDSHLDIVRFVNRGEIDKEFYREWPIAVEIRGSYHNLALFFDRLSRFSRLFNIENFAIRALPRQTDSETITANLTVKTYIFKESPPPQKPGRKGPGR